MRARLTIMTVMLPAEGYRMNMTKELIGVPCPSCHATTLEMWNGELFMAYFAGTRAGADDVDIYVPRKPGEKWSEPVRVSAGPLPHCNPVLRRDGDGLVLYFKYGREIPMWRTYTVRLDRELNLKEGPRELVPGDTGGRGPVRNRCLVLPDGTILAPASTEGEHWSPFIDLSTDGGRHFEKCPIPLKRAGSSGPEYAYTVTGKGAIQPALWRDESGVHALLRSTEGKVLRSDSSDSGRSWCYAYDAGIPNNNSGISVDTCGSVFLALNPVSGNWAARTPLEVWESKDGARFDRLCVLEDGEGEYSYPCLLADGGILYVSYTYRREKAALCVIDPAGL